MITIAPLLKSQYGIYAECVTGEGMTTDMPTSSTAPPSMTTPSISTPPFIPSLYAPCAGEGKIVKTP
jgi:hypothetical protein